MISFPATYNSDGQLSEGREEAVNEPTETSKTNEHKSKGREAFQLNDDDFCCFEENFRWVFHSFFIISVML